MLATPTTAAVDTRKKWYICGICIWVWTLFSCLSRRQWKRAAGLLFTGYYCWCLTLRYSDPPPLPPQPGLALLDEWVELGGLYVQTVLTRESDRQIAIAGLARRFAHRLEQCAFPSTYYAGLWSHNIFIQLLWTSLDGSLKLDDKIGCPSWSWLYSHTEDNKKSINTSYVRHVEARCVPSFKHLAQIEEIETVPMDATNPFGPVKFGRLRLLSYYFKTKVRSDEWSHRRKSVPRVQLHVDVAYKVACPEVYMRIDYLDEKSGARSMRCTDSDEEFTFLVLAYGEGWPPPAKYHGLILQKAPVGYPLMPNNREGEYWVRRGKWEEDIHRENMNAEEKETRKLIEKSMSNGRMKEAFEII